MRRIAILGGVFVLLALVLVVQRVQRSKLVVSGPQETVAVNPDQVTRVSVHKKDGDVELVKSGSDWRLTKPVDYPANQDMITTMLKSVEALKLVDVISTNPATRGTYQVDSTGTEVEIWAGDKQLMGLIIGKSSADWTHTFVRRKDGKEVFRAEGVLAYNFNRRPEDWRDKSILKLDEATVTRVALEYPKDRVQLALVRTDSTHWGLEVPGKGIEPADSTTAARLVQGAAKLSTVNFATDAEATGKDFAQADLRLVVTAGATTHRVDFLTIDDTKMLARRDGNPTVFSLFKSNLGNLMKKPDDLRRKAAAQS